MSFSIQTNVNSLVAQENLRVNNDFQSRTIGRLTSGYRITASGDDAAGLAVANKFRSSVSELTQGVRNANDGLSQMQIIDGGLNNITKMLDRLKTLATQSASTTFSGNRTTLDDEYQALLQEINRQAANIGLGTGTSEASKYNTEIKVYTGGGSEQANAQVSVDLSGSANRVDATALDLSDTSVEGNANAVAVGDVDLREKTDILQGGTQQFTLKTVDGTVQFTLDGGAAGYTTDAFVNELNERLIDFEASASVNETTGFLQISSTTKGFTFQIGAPSSVEGTAAHSAGVFEANSGMHLLDDVAIVNAGGTAGEGLTLTFKIDGVTVGATSGLVGTSTAATIVNQIKSVLSGSDIQVLDGDGANELVFMSTSAFTVERTGTYDNDEGFEGITNADRDEASVAPTGDTDVTAKALAAITKITDAVTYLGKVQGKVGSGQNKLQYAITLAQSQISNFAAAESRIRDADVASEAANLTKAQVLQQASLAAMAQANSAPQAVLALLRG